MDGPDSTMVRVDFASDPKSEVSVFGDENKTDRQGISAGIKPSYLGFAARHRSCPSRAVVFQVRTS